MTDTERAILEAVQEWFSFYGGYRIGTVSRSTVDAKLDAVIEACDKHINDHDGQFPVSDD